uniref:Uncharacterized protein n=1 Tax=Clastoptera arizonana TaxID=38151 RepID=A0A1B6E8X6_9HEMI
MKAKVKVEGDFKSKSLLKAAKVVGNMGPVENLIGRALLKARRYLKRKQKVRVPRVLPLQPKAWQGGFLIPLFAGLSALGSLAGGAPAVTKAITETKEAHSRLEEMKRHNRALGRARTLLKTVSKRLRAILETLPNRVLTNVDITQALACLPNFSLCEMS